MKQAKYSRSVNSLTLLCACLIITLLLTLPVQADPGSIEVLREVVWKLRLSVLIQNPSSRQSEVDFSYPLVVDDSPAQQVVSKDFSPMPMKVARDTFGNTVGIWKVRISAGQIKTLNFSYTIRTRHVRWQGPVEPGYQKLPAQGSESLGDQPMIQSSNPLIRKTAMRLCTGETYPYYRALILYDYLISHYSFDSRKNMVSAAEAIGEKTLQCGDATLLYVALLRTSGIPSRFVGGFFITPGKEAYKEFHAWAEILLPGHSWASVDPTLGRLDGGHRLRCFLERRDQYIALWRGDPEIFKIHDPSSGKERARVSFRINISEVSHKEVMRPETGAHDSSSASLTIKTKWESRSSPASRMHYGRGKEYEAGDSPDQALSQYFKSLQISPAYLEPVLALLRLHESGTGKKEIYREFCRRVEKNPHDALALYARGDLERQLHTYSASSSDFDRAERYGFRSPALFLSRMRLYARTKEITRFDGAFATSHSLSGSALEAYRMALLFYQDLEMWDRCMTVASQGRHLIPSSSIFPAMEGYACLKKGSLARALISIDEAIAEDPGVGWYHCIRGWILLRRGEKSAARQAIEKGITLGSGVDNPGFFRHLLETGGE